MLLGAFSPMVVGFGLLVAIAVLVREIRLAEIASKLDPDSREEDELLNTARMMLRHTNYTMGHLSEHSDSLKYAERQQQKESSKRFIEKKLMELKSTK